MNATTPIRMLMSLRHAAYQRDDAVDAASKVNDWSHAEWASASRIWSRQAEALLLAVIAEPPTNLGDTLSVLICVAEMRYQHAEYGEDTRFRERDVVEMTDTAIHNCIRALAGNIAPQDEPLGSEQRDIEWTAEQVAHWLPQPVGAQAEGQS